MSFETPQIKQPEVASLPKPSPRLNCPEGERLQRRSYQLPPLVGQGLLQLSAAAS